MAAWQVQISERDTPQNRVVAWLGDGPPTPSGGGGGWESVALMRTHAVMVWRGTSGVVQSVPMVLGATSAQVPVGPMLQALTLMWRPEDDGPPPVVRIYAEGDTVLYQNLDYVITNMELGDAVASPAQLRVQQAVTLELTEYKPDAHLVPATQRSAAGAPRRARAPRTYRVKAGDTLSGIAKRFKVKSWRSIAELNKITDPRSVKVGTVLKIPPA